MIFTGTVLSVSKVPLGDVLAVDAAQSATSITVQDANDFGEDGGTLSINGQVIAYSTADMDTGVIKLATGLNAAAHAEDQVYVWDPAENGPAYEHQALVDLPGEVNAGDAVLSTVNASLAGYVGEGIRDLGAGEQVTLESDDDGLEWFVTDLPGKLPQLSGSYLLPDSVMPESLGFELSNGTKVTISDTAPTGPSTDDVWVDTGNGSVLKKYNGATWDTYQFGSGALGAASVTADHIVASAIIAGKIAAGALDAMTINAGSLTAGDVSAGSIGESYINSCMIRDTVMELDDQGAILLYALTGTTTDVISATGTWQCPGGVTYAKVECIGGGGGATGGKLASNGEHRGGFGGSGGEWACDWGVPVTPGNSYPCTVGAGGAGNAAGDQTKAANGGDTIFNNGTVTAHGGKGAEGNTKEYGGSGSTDDAHYQGGANSTYNGFHPPGNGGGAAAAPTHAGNAGHQATDTVPGAGGSGTIYGSTGGNGGDYGQNGFNGEIPGAGGGGGGGGAGATNGWAGGSGAHGQIRITYQSTRSLIASIAAAPGTDVYGNSYYAGVKVYLPATFGVIGGDYRQASYTKTVQSNTVTQLTSMTTVKELRDGATCWGNGAYTVARDGLYSAYFQCDNLGTSTARGNIAIRVNTNKVAQIERNDVVPDCASTAMLNYWCNEGDVIDFVFWQYSGSAIVFTGQLTLKREA